MFKCLHTLHILSELDEALKQAKHDKAPDLDNIHPEFLKHLSNTARKWLIQFFSGILDGGSVSSELKRPKILAILKTW